MNQPGGILLNSLRPAPDAVPQSAGTFQPLGTVNGPAFSSYLAEPARPADAPQQRPDSPDEANLRSAREQDAQRTAEQREREAAGREERSAEQHRRNQERDERIERAEQQRVDRQRQDQEARQQRSDDQAAARKAGPARESEPGVAADRRVAEKAAEAEQDQKSEKLKSPEQSEQARESKETETSIESAVRKILREHLDSEAAVDKSAKAGKGAQALENLNKPAENEQARETGSRNINAELDPRTVSTAKDGETLRASAALFGNTGGTETDAAGKSNKVAAKDAGEALAASGKSSRAEQLNGLQAQAADAKSAGEAAGLKEFLRKMGSAVEREAQQATRSDAAASNGEASGKAKGADSGANANTDAARKLELDAAKWQIHGRAYGERQAAKGESTEQRLSELVDRYAAKKEAARASNRSNSGGARGDQQQQQNTGRSNELQSIQVGDFRDVNSREALDLGRQKEEFVRENRKLFNELVEKARVNVQSNGNSSASIRMNPAALGRMTLNLNVQQNQVHARILVETDAARRLVMDEMDHLRSELTRQGISVESLSVRVREPASMSFMDGANQQDRNQQSTLEQDGGQSQRDQRSSEDEQAAVPGSRQHEQGADEYERGVPDAVSGATTLAAAGGVNISI